MPKFYIFDEVQKEWSGAKEVDEERSK